MSRIPVPSFTTTIKSSWRQQPSSNDNNNKKKQGDDVDVFFVPIPTLIDQWMIQLEVALQIYFSHIKSNEITYEKFRELVPKLNLERGECQEMTDKVTEDLPRRRRTNTFSDTSERLWHDFICVTTPILYVWNDDENNNNNNNNNKYGDGSILRRVETRSGKRLDELKRLLKDVRTRGTPVVTSDKIATFFQIQREASAQSSRRKEERKYPDKEPFDLLPRSSESHKNNNITTNPVVGRLSSLKELEDKIRAKAEENRRHLERLERNRPQIVQNEHLTIADALVLHARQMLRRQRTHGLVQQNRFRSMVKPPTIKKVDNASNTTTTICRMTFQSVIKAIPSYTRQQLSKNIQQLSEKYPDWISWPSVNVMGHRPHDDGTKDAILSSSTIITIETTNYKKVRSQLLGIDEGSEQDQQSPMRVPLLPALPLQLPPEGTPPQPTANIPAVTISGRKRSASSSLAENKTSLNGRRIRAWS